MEDEEVEEVLRDACIPEFTWDHTLRTLGHGVVADHLDAREFRNGHVLLHAGSMRDYDLLWYGVAKHLVLMDETIEFLSLHNIVDIALGEMGDTASDHIFLEGFIVSLRDFPLNGEQAHLVTEQVRQWIMGERCVYPYLRGANTASMAAWWGEDFTAYLCELTTDYYYTPERVLQRNG